MGGRGMYIVSACLVGVNCKYHGGNNDHEKVKAFLEGKDYILVCPEELAGFGTPRPPAEITDGRVYNKFGLDITEGFIKGAEMTYACAAAKAAELGQSIEQAIFKAKSPSCGSGRIYDGTFTGVIVEGDGFAAAYLKKMGIPVITEEDF
jgi:uncharacterized protein YbbK (DUF523 family)